jgi:hypothetical protein
MSKCEVQRDMQQKKENLPIFPKWGLRELY